MALIMIDAHWSVLAVDESVVLDLSHCGRTIRSCDDRSVLPEPVSDAFVSHLHLLLWGYWEWAHRRCRRVRHEQVSRVSRPVTRHCSFPFLLETRSACRSEISRASNHCGLAPLRDLRSNPTVPRCRCTERRSPGTIALPACQRHHTDIRPAQRHRGALRPAPV